MPLATSPQVSGKPGEAHDALGGHLYAEMLHQAVDRARPADLLDQLVAQLGGSLEGRLGLGEDAVQRRPATSRTAQSPRRSPRSAMPPKPWPHDVMSARPP